MIALLAPVGAETVAAGVAIPTDPVVLSPMAFDPAIAVDRVAMLFVGRAFRGAVAIAAALVVPLAAASAMAVMLAVRSLLMSNAGEMALLEPLSRVIALIEDGRAWPLPSLRSAMASAVGVFISIARSVGASATSVGALWAAKSNEIALALLVTALEQALVALMPSATSALLVAAMVPLVRALLRPRAIALLVLALVKATIVLVAGVAIKLMAVFVRPLALA